MINSSSISEPQNNNFDSSHHNFPYKDLNVWHKSIQFASDVMDLTETLRITRKNYRLFEQLEAAVTSIPMNIAEGKGRISKKEFCHFLMIARGSLYEKFTLLEIFKFRS
jgi:four helix bundle protein